ncbi:unnamed protein product [Lupinus luteus]|uniref:Uncharacterized protein n=1 Tax=Lupinus luteus TaxID=3873 RepID=A0AAV1XNE7_LUPLU
MVGPTFTIVGDQPPLFHGGSAYRNPEFFTGDSSESSSSIGSPGESDTDEEVQSKLKSSFENSLNIEKGLSSHFIGKSKSFTDLSQVNTVKELEKQENPFNKRKRVLIAAKWSRTSFYSCSNPKSMPILPIVDEDQDDNNNYYDKEEEEGEEDKVSRSSSSSSLDNRVPQSYASHMRLTLRSFKSRSFSLADLQEHDNEEEDED